MYNEWLFIIAEYQTNYQQNRKKCPVTELYNVVLFCADKSGGSDGESGTGQSANIQLHTTKLHVVA